MSEKSKPGAFTEARPVNPDDVEFFKETLGKIVGVTYKPTHVATQIVTGTNYIFLCDCSMASNPPKDGKAVVYIFKALECYGGKAMVTDIVTFFN